MSILSGRNAQVKYDPAAVTPVLISSLNAWSLNFATEKEDVSCFGDTNRVYVPGLPDCQGSLAGFWNSAASVVLFEAAQATTPGKLELIPTSVEPTFKFSGLAYIDATIDCTMAAPKISSSWMAAGPWVQAP